MNNIDFLQNKLDEAQRDYDAVKRKRNNTHGSEKARLLRLLKVAKDRYSNALAQNQGQLPVAAPPPVQPIQAAAAVAVQPPAQPVQTAAAIPGPPPAQPVQAAAAIPGPPPAQPVQAAAAIPGPPPVQPAHAAPAVSSFAQQAQAAATVTGPPLQPPHAATTVPPVVQHVQAIATGAGPPTGQPAHAATAVAVQPLVPPVQATAPVATQLLVQAAPTPASVVVPAQIFAATVQPPAMAAQSQVTTPQLATIPAPSTLATNVLSSPAQINAIPVGQPVQGPTDQVPQAPAPSQTIMTAPVTPTTTPQVTFALGVPTIGSGSPLQGSQTTGVQVNDAHSPAMVAAQMQALQAMSTNLRRQDQVAPIASLVSPPAVLVQHGTIQTIQTPVAGDPRGSEVTNNGNNAAGSPSPAYSNMEDSASTAASAVEFNPGSTTSPAGNSLTSGENSQNAGSSKPSDSHVDIRIDLNSLKFENTTQESGEEHGFGLENTKYTLEAPSNPKLFYVHTLQSSAQEDKQLPAPNSSTAATATSNELSEEIGSSLSGSSQNFNLANFSYIPQMGEGVHMSNIDGSYSLTAQINRTDFSASNMAERGLNHSSLMSSIFPLSQDGAMLENSAALQSASDVYNENYSQYPGITMEGLLTMSGPNSMPPDNHVLENIFHDHSNTYNFDLPPQTQASSSFSQANFENLLHPSQSAHDSSTEPVKYTSGNISSPLSFVARVDMHVDPGTDDAAAEDDINNIPRIWEASQRVGYMKEELSNLEHSERNEKEQMEMVAQQFHTGDMNFKAIQVMLDRARPFEKSLQEIQTRMAALSSEITEWEGKLSMFTQHERNLRRRSRLEAENAAISATVDAPHFIDYSLYAKLGQRRERIIYELDEITKELERSMPFVENEPGTFPSPQTEHMSFEEENHLEEEENTRKRKLPDSDDDDPEEENAEEESEGEQPPRKKGKAMRNASEVPDAKNKGSNGVAVTNVAQEKGLESALNSQYKGRMPSTRLRLLAGKIKAMEEELRPPRKEKSVVAQTKAAKRLFRVEDLPVNDCPIPGITVSEYEELCKEGSAQVRDFLKSGKRESLKGSIRRLARDYYEFLPETSCQTRELAVAIHYTEQGTYKCRFHSRHRNRREHDGVGPTKIQGVAYKPDLRPKSPPNGHFHCGCFIEDVLLDYWWWKKWTATSTNPEVTAVEGMKAESDEIFPRSRAFLCQNFRAYTRLSVNDIYGFEGLDDRPLWQHVARVQAERLVEELKTMGVDVVLSFGDLRVQSGTGSSSVFVAGANSEGGDRP